MKASDLKMDVLDPAEDPQSWDHAVSTFPDATVFHSAAWATILCRTYRGRQKPFYLRFRSAQREPVALVPLMEVASPITGRRGVCLPFSDLCPPLLRSGCDPEAIQKHLAELARDRRWKTLELRGGESNVGSSPSQPHPPLPATPTFYGHHLDLTIGSEALLAGCSSSVRRALRKANRGSLNVRIEHSAAAMREFFRLHTSTRRRHGLPPQPYRFFHNIHEELIRDQSGFIVLASHNETRQAVAAAVFLRFGSAAVYKFGASDESEWKLRPNNLVMWEGIRHLADSGAETLHFGRTTPAQDGLRRFKLSWGSEEEPIQYLQYQPLRDSWQAMTPSTSTSRTTTIAHKLFAHAPLVLNRLAGSLIYPHLD